MSSTILSNYPLANWLNCQFELPVCRGVPPFRSVSLNIIYFFFFSGIPSVTRSVVFL